MLPARYATALSLALVGATASADPLVDVIDRSAVRTVLDGVLGDWSGALNAVDGASQVTDGAAALWERTARAPDVVVYVATLLLWGAALAVIFRPARSPAG